MQRTTPDTAQLTEAVNLLRADVAGLAERVAALELAADRSSDGVSDELVIVISAALAAYLGEKPRIRQIRLIGGRSWVQQGRATIQASHNLKVSHA